MGQLGLHCEWSSREVVVGGWVVVVGGMVRTLQNQEERPKRQSVRATRAGARGFILSAFKKGGNKHTEYLECVSQPPMDKESWRAEHLRINRHGRMGTLSQ